MIDRGSQLKAQSESRFLISKQELKPTEISLFPSNIFQENEKPARAAGRNFPTTTSYAAAILIKSQLKY